MVHYEDVPHARLILIPPSSPEYAALLADIRTRCSHSAGAIDAFSREHDTPAVFLNRNAKAIALLQVLWRHELPDGRPFVAACAWGGGEALLFPIGLTPPARAALGYGSSIFSGSKRYLTTVGGSKMLGDNTDVRPPGEHEIWKGGVVGGSGGGRIITNPPLRPITISIEGAFFMDGEFAGSNRTMLFEQVTSEAAAYLRVANMARRGKNMSPSAILNKIERLTGKAGDTDSIPLLPPKNTTAAAYERQALQNVANHIAGMRHAQTDEQILRTLAEWADVSWPNFRKRQLTEGF